MWFVSLGPHHSHYGEAAWKHWRYPLAPRLVLIRFCFRQPNPFPRFTTLWARPGQWSIGEIHHSIWCRLGFSLQWPNVFCPFWFLVISDFCWTLTTISREITDLLDDILISDTIQFVWNTAYDITYEIIRNITYDIMYDTWYHTWYHTWFHTWYHMHYNTICVGDITYEIEVWY